MNSNIFGQNPNPSAEILKPWHIQTILPLVESSTPCKLNKFIFTLRPAQHKYQNLWFC